MPSLHCELRRGKISNLSDGLVRKIEIFHPQIFIFQILPRMLQTLSHFFFG